MTVRSIVAAAVLMALPGQALAAEAASSCLSSGEVRALAAFAMPSALTGVIDTCAPQVGADSFLATRGRGLVAAPHAPILRSPRSSREM